jgi:iron-sulfur cluster assembly protein
MWRSHPCCVSIVNIPYDLIGENTMVSSKTLPPLITITDAAMERLRTLYRNTEDKILRISVKSKGCSGLSYYLHYVSTPESLDEKVMRDDITLLVDRKATLFLAGTIMDYETGALSSGFKFINPNEKGRCGCGESFHI